MRGHFQNLQRARRQQRFFNTNSMDIPAPSTPRTRKISKQHNYFDTSLTFPRRSKKIFQSPPQTPIKKQNHQRDLQKTIKLQQLFPTHQSMNPPLHYYESYNSYTLGSINSISFSNGRIYDLLQIKKNSSLFTKSTKCRCSRSKCIANYCQCFSKGKACNEQCGCRGCENLTDHNPGPKAFQEVRICRCSKSNCLKNYCECHQRGQRCSSKCKCQNCKNTGIQKS